MEATFQGQKLFVARLTIGLAQGLALYLLYGAYDDKVWPATQGLVFAPLVVGCFFIPFLLISALGEMAWSKALGWAAATLIVIAALAFFDNWQAWPQDWTFGAASGRPHVTPSPQLVFFGGAGLFVAHALVVGGNADRRFMASYPTHFDTAWKLAVQLALAGLFVGAFWILLFLGAGLFDLIKLDFLHKLIRHEWFGIPATTLAAAGALHLTDIRPALVRGARTLLLTLLSWLLPLITLIVAGFVISLPFTGLKALWSIGHASALLLAATAALIILINAAHQDGAPEHLPPKLLRFSGTLAAILPVPMTLIAAYALFLRVHQHGWSVDRVMMAACVIAALGYACGYARAAAKRGAWLHAIKTWNFGMALLVLAEIVALFTPIASPARIAVADQMARLDSGKISPKDFDYQFLRWQGGRYGRNALQELAARGDAADRRMAQNALEARTRYGAPMIGAPAVENRLAVYPQGATLPQSFVRMDWNKEGRVWMRPSCPRGQTCDAIITDLDGDGRPEIMIGTNPPYLLQLFHEGADGDWSNAGTIMLPQACPTLMEALRQGHFKTPPPAMRWNDIEWNGVRLHVRESEFNQILPNCPG